MEANYHYLDLYQSQNCKIECSYDIKDSRERIGEEDGKTVCLLMPTDLPFKKKTDTLPRTELRCVDEYVGYDSVTITTGFQLESANSNDEFAVFQVFARSPYVMLRRLVTGWEVICFEAVDRHQKIRKVEVDPIWTDVIVNIKKIDDKHQAVTVVINKVELPTIECKLKLRDQLHWKLGPYAQHKMIQDPVKLYLNKVDVKCI